MKRKDDERAKIIDEGIRLTWSSLESHLGYTHKAEPKGYQKRKLDKPFDKKCVQDYARIIQILSKLY